MSVIIELCDSPKFLEENNRSRFSPDIVTEAVLGKSIFKFEQTSISEVFGYQIAEAIRVRVPQMQGFWTPQALRIKNKFIKAPGRIGILVKYYEDWQPLDIESAVKLDIVQAARALVLCVFDRNEWGEFGLSGHMVYFVDIEWLLPIIKPEALLAASEQDRMKMLNNSALSYHQSESSAIDKVLKEAKRLGIQDRVEQELRQLCRLKSDKYCQFLKISGHPLEKMLSRFATSMFGHRLNSIARWFDLPTHKVPAWR